MSEFEENILSIYGAPGQKWLTELPSLVSRLAAQWNLHSLVSVENLTYNYVARGLQRDVPIALKIGFSSSDIGDEVAALRSFGLGMVTLLAYDAEQKALLLEGLGPSLISLMPDHEREAANIAAGVIAAIHRNQKIDTGYKFNHFRQWLVILDEEWNFPQRHLALARTMSKKLLNTANKEVLLHGDFHYDNVLSSADGWKAIDPKGVIGDPVFDMSGCLVREPFNELMSRKDVLDIVRLRIDTIANYFQMSPKRIIEWTYVQTVLSVCWSLEDNMDVRLKNDFLQMFYQHFLADLVHE